MRRADRLFQILQFLRGGRLVTAQQLAERLEVSPRTVYRDIADLQGSGVPVEGEAGVGYILREGFDLPPLMFTRDEIVALVMGARLARAWGGATTARAAQEALIKIEAVLPKADRGRIASTEIHAFSYRMDDRVRELFDRVEKAADQQRVQHIHYQDEQGARSKRDVRPLGLWFWGKVWTIVAWCELRDDFRMFRLDRIEECQDAGRGFADENGKTLRDFYRRMASQE